MALNRQSAFNTAYLGLRNQGVSTVCFFSRMLSVPWYVGAQVRDWTSDSR
jgi:hypothetical protein